MPTKEYMTNQELIDKARTVAIPRELSRQCNVGHAGAALITDKGNVYVGASIDASSGIGFCAEHAAISNMITNGESRIMTLASVGQKQKIYSPCGRCRELMYLVNKENMSTDIVLGFDRVMKLKELLPEPWQEIA